MAQTTTDRRGIGAGGEDVAVEFLVSRGWRVLARNWRCRAGEIDIIAIDPDGVVVVCEVKTRRGLGYGDPLESLTYAKVRRLHGLALEWIRSQEERVGRVRLDAIGVLMDADGRVRVRHVRNLDRP